MLLYNLSTKALLDLFLQLLCGVSIEEERGFLPVYFLPRCMLICLKNLFQVTTIFPSSLAKIILSSAKKRCEIYGPSGQATTPLSRPVVVAYWRRDESLSSQNRKKKGEMGSPCLKPRERMM